MIRNDAILPYLEYKNFTITGFPKPTPEGPDFNYIELHVLENDNPVCKTEPLSIKELRKELKEKKFYEIQTEYDTVLEAKGFSVERKSRVRIPSKSLAKLLGELDNNTLEEEQARSYRRKRSRIYYGDKKVEKIPTHEVIDKIKSKIKKEDLHFGTIDISFSPYWVIWDHGEKILKDENHARRYVNRVNNLSSYVREIESGAKHLRPLPSLMAAKSSGKFDLSRFPVEKTLLKLVEKILLNSDEIDFCHFLKCRVSHDGKELTEFAYYSPIISKSSLDKLRSGERNFKKPEYTEAYSLKDIWDILEHYFVVGEEVAKACKSREISIKCLDFVDVENPDLSIHDILPSNKSFEELDKKFRQTSATTRRNWPRKYKKVGKVKIGEVEDILDIVHDMLGFEFIPVIHKTDIYDSDLSSYPIDAVRDFDPKIRDYNKLSDDLKTVIDFDKELGLKEKIRATGSTLGGFHIVIPIVYKDILIPPTSDLRLDTYERRRTDAEIWLASLKETMKTYSLIQSLLLDVNFGVNPNSLGEVLSFDAILDTSPIAINTGYKAPFTLNANKRDGVNTPVREIPQTAKEYEKVTSKDYVHRNIKNLEEAEFSLKTKEENFKIIRDFLEEQGGMEVNSIYEKFKNYWTHRPRAAYRFIKTKILQ